MINQLVSNCVGIPHPAPLNWTHLPNEHKNFDTNNFFRKVQIFKSGLCYLMNLDRDQPGFKINNFDKHAKEYHRKQESYSPKTGFLLKDSYVNGS